MLSYLSDLSSADSLLFWGSEHDRKLFLNTVTEFLCTLSPVLQVASEELQTKSIA